MSNVGYTQGNLVITYGTTFYHSFRIQASDFIDHTILFYFPDINKIFHYTADFESKIPLWHCRWHSLPAPSICQTLTAGKDDERQSHSPPQSHAPSQTLPDTSSTADVSHHRHHPESNAHALQCVTSQSNALISDARMPVLTEKAQWMVPSSPP